MHVCSKLRLCFRRAFGNALPVLHPQGVAPGRCTPRLCIGVAGQPRCGMVSCGMVGGCCSFPSAAPAPAQGWEPGPISLLQHEKNHCLHCIRAGNASGLGSASHRSAWTLSARTLCSPGLAPTCLCSGCSWGQETSPLLCTTGSVPERCRQR